MTGETVEKEPFGNCELGNAVTATLIFEASKAEAMA